MINLDFKKALRNCCLEEIQKCHKTDLHNHASRGGNLLDYARYFNLNDIPHIIKVSSIEDMEKWYDNNIKFRFTMNMYSKRIEWAFNQLNRDNVRLCILTFGLSELNLFNSFKDFIYLIRGLKKTIIPNIIMIPELGIPSNCNIKEVIKECEKIFAYHFFESIDISGREMDNPLYYLPLFKLAEKYGLRKRAHVGEFGSANLIKKAIDILNLNEINHGINAIYDFELIKIIRERKIRLNICPASNIYLGLSKNYLDHPIRCLYDNNIIITVNTDDMLIFNASVSKQYLDLYINGVFNENELDVIRKNGLDLEVK